MTQDTLAYADSVARTARRSPMNEASLVWALLWCLFTLIFLVAWTTPTKALSSITQMSLLVSAVLLAIPVSGIFAYFQLLRAKRITKIARDENQRITAATRAKLAAEVQMKMDQMNAGKGD